MGFFLPSFWQKRILRYALSQIDLLDTDALDLEKLDVAIGRRSTVELKDVGIRLDKLPALLKLPTHVKVNRANILLVRVHVPADIYKSGIVLEVEGVRVEVNIGSSKSQDSGNCGAAESPDHAYGSRGAKPASHGNPNLGREKAGNHEYSVNEVEEPFENHAVPTAADLAQSFLNTEPKEETEQLRETILKAQGLAESQTSEDGDLGSDEGVGDGFSMPGFISGFIKGVVNRMEATATDIRLDINVAIDKDTLSNSVGSPGQLDGALVRFSIAEVKVDKVVTQDYGKVPKQEHSTSEMPSIMLGSRSIHVSGVEGSILTEPTLFASLGHYAGPPSPVTAYSSAVRRQGLSKDSNPLSDEASSSSETGLGLSRRSFAAQLTQSDGSAIAGTLRKNNSTLGDSQRSASLDLEASVDSYKSLSSIERSIYEDSWEDDTNSTQYASIHNDGDRGSEGLVDSENDLQGSRNHSQPSADGPGPLSYEALFQTSTSENLITTLPRQYSTDNLRFGFESQGHSNRFLPDSGEIASPDPDIFENRSSPDSSVYNSTSGFSQDLTQSRLFTHEEAESMYQSAVSHAPYKASSLSPEREAQIPGQWTDDDETIHLDKRSATPTPNVNSFIEPSQDVNNGQETSHPIENPANTLSLDESTSTIRSVPPIDESNPEVTESDLKSTKSESSTLLSRFYGGPLLKKRFLYVDFITLSLPEKDTTHPKISNVETLQLSKGLMPQHLPGGFSESTYSRNSTMPLDESVSYSKISEKSPKIQKATTEADEALSIRIRECKVSIDLSMVRLAVLVSSSISQILQDEGKSSHKANSNSQLGPSVLFRLERFEIGLLSSVKGDLIRSFAESEPRSLNPILVDIDTLLSLRMSALTMVQTYHAGSINRELNIGQFTFGYEDSSVIEFDSSLRLRESTRDVLTPSGQDIKIESKSLQDGSLDVTIMTVPIHLNFDLGRLDETFSWFGGLSGIIEIGSSVISTVTVMEHKTSRAQSVAKKGRTVRFEKPDLEPPTPPANSAPTKITARLGGLLIDVQGKEVPIKLEGSAVKVVSRLGGIRARIDRVKLLGPAVSMVLSEAKLEYLQFPTEEDLDKLLGLLSPSRDRDEPDGDILLDTFLRQRRQGGILRIIVDKVVCHTGDKEDLMRLSTMSEEFKKLSTVTKYLPEDDRPGILTLAKIQQFDLNAKINNTFGSVNVLTSQIEVGHVSFPSLLLLGIDKVAVGHGSDELIGSALPREGILKNNNKPTGIHNRPEITARLIGDDLEPTLKIRLWNICLGYHVSTLMTFMGISESTTGEVIVNDLVKSVATLMELTEPQLTREDSLDSNSSSASKTLRFDIGMRECMVSLNPRKSRAQGLLVFTQSRFTGAFPNDSQSDVYAAFDIQKMSILIIDDTKNVRYILEEQNPTYTRVENREIDQLDTLQDMGYVSVSEISSARIGVAATFIGNSTERCIEVQVKDDLFVLETCADSTQTLQIILNGLSPPMPPSKDLKYRTEVIPVQDMLASFTGDSFEAEPTNEDDTNYGSQLYEEDFVDDDVPHNLEFVNSFYDPDALATQRSSQSSSQRRSLAIGRPSQGNNSGQIPLTAGSNYEEDGDGSQPLYFDENHFDSQTKSQEQSSNWNSNLNAYDEKDDDPIKRSPFKLRLRDVHVIWNLFDGYDWQRTRDAISTAVAEVEHKAAEKQARRDKRRSLDDDEDEDSVIGDFLFNSIYIGVGVNQNPRDLARQVNRNLDDLASEAESFSTVTGTAVSASPSRRGRSKSRRNRLRLQRSKHHKMTFELKGVAADIVVFPPELGENQSSIDIRIHDLDIYDHVPTSTWKKFATYMHEAGERESESSMVRINILNVKPDKLLAASEIVFKATVLPLRLHVDQDALDFLTRFFEFKDEGTPSNPTSSEPPFIQRAEVNSIPIKLDFKPKRVDYGGLRSGRTTEFMNFIVLDGAEMVLRRVIIYGVSGFDKLGLTLNDIWSPDVKRNQLPSVLAGLAPVRSFVNVGSGVKDLVVIPMREYRKDGRIVRSIQKGALAFAKTTTTELARLGTKLAVGTQTVLQNAEGMLVTKSDPSDANLSESPPEEKPVISPYADLPLGVMQGLRGGYRHLERDLLLAKDAIVAMPGEVMESGSASGAAKAVLRGAPTIILRPALGVSKAVGQALMGATSALDKDERRRVDDKYKRVR